MNKGSDFKRNIEKRQQAFNRKYRKCNIKTEIILIK